MDHNLIELLHREEQAILHNLRGSLAYRRLEEIRRLLRLYDAQPPIGAVLDAMLAERRSGDAQPTAVHQSVIPLQGERPTADVA